MYRQIYAVEGSCTCKIIAASCFSLLEIQGCILADTLRPSSEEHGHPLVDKIERNASALQRSDGWEAARGAAEGLLVSPEGLQMFGQSLEQTLGLISVCHVFRLRRESLTAQVELTGQSFVLFSVCRFPHSIKKHLVNNLTPLLFHTLKSI